MDEFIDVLHSFNAGDAIVSLCGLKALSELKGKKIRFYQRLGLSAHYFDGQIASTVNEKNESVCMNERLFSMLQPLIAAQPYIESCEIFTGQSIHYNFDLTRDSKSIAMPAGTTHSWYMGVFPEMNCDPSKPWIEVPERDSMLKDLILVNRTHRYTNPYINFFFLKKYEEQVFFSGTDDEYESFKKEWDLNIGRINADNFYHLAKIIQSVKFGIYNQSMHFHIADATSSKRVLELNTMFPNTFINGANGCQFYHQKALEYYVERLMN